MPLYFAYGSNMDEAAMRTRCPRAKALGRARLARHRFLLMGNGWASVRRDPRSEVHGILFDLALSDVGPLDRYEGVADGLYTKAVQPVFRDAGGPVRALVYFGADPSEGGRPPQGYMEGIVAAARAVSLPDAYLAALEAFVPGRRSSGVRAIGRPL